MSCGILNMRRVISPIFRYPFMQHTSLTSPLVHCAVTTLPNGEKANRTDAVQMATRSIFQNYSWWNGSTERILNHRPPPFGLIRQSLKRRCGSFPLIQKPLHAASHSLEVTVSCALLLRKGSGSRYILVVTFVPSVTVLQLLE